MSNLGMCFPLFLESVGATLRRIRLLTFHPKQTQTAGAFTCHQEHRPPCCLMRWHPHLKQRGVCVSGRVCRGSVRNDPFVASLILPAHPPPPPTTPPPPHPLLSSSPPSQDITADGSCTNRIHLDLFDWGLQGLLMTYASAPEATGGHSRNASMSFNFNFDDFDAEDELDRAHRGGWVAADASETLAAAAAALAGERGEGVRGRRGRGGAQEAGPSSAVSSSGYGGGGGGGGGGGSGGSSSGGGGGGVGGLLSSSSFHQARHQRRRSNMADITASQLSSLQPSGPQYGAVMPWIAELVDAVGPRPRDGPQLLLAMSSRIATQYYPRWPRRKEKARAVARLLVTAHQHVGGLTEEQMKYAVRVGERMWGFSLPNAATLRLQCEVRLMGGWCLLGVRRRRAMSPGHLFAWLAMRLYISSLC